MLSKILNSTVVQTVQDRLWPESFVSFEICCIKFQWYNGTNSTKLVRSQKYGSYLKNISQTFNGTVVQTVQNYIELKIFTISKKCQLKFEWYSGTKSTKNFRS